MGSTPQGIALTPDGARAYVGNANVGTVGVMATTVIPDQGSTAGGTTVTLTGHHLAHATAVHFGTAQAVITANTATSVTVTTPLAPVPSP
ncbi:IPT/TIG domain-containing protein [Streptomyces sioyaensis]|uniref:IPT/TIG domain-containing protein n=1 Tax=Streptomyces sioyaensis TaxID=67364 RepID=UPI0033CDEDB4